MKPLNLDNRPCSPVSSNCVVWQGPTLDCINLCTGDTISDVVAKMATELCTLLDQTNVTNYDLSCLGITACGPKDFQALIQLLIEKICELEGIPTDTTRFDSACPDCVVTVKPCFVQNNQTTMQLVDYVQMIAQKVCDLIDQIGDLQSQINNLDIRVTVLENTPAPENVIPSFTLTSCPIGSLPTGSTQFINTILQEFINNVWCPFYTATGTTSELINAVNAKCIDDTDLQLTTGTPFSFNPNWIQNASYSTVADAINNVWIALCDMFTYLTNQSTSVNVQDTNTIDLEFSAGVLTANVQDTGWQPLEGFDLYMNEDSGTQYAYPQVRRIGNVLHFRGSIVIPLAESTGAVRPWINTTTENNYEQEPSTGAAVTLKSPYTGVGGVILGSFGSIQFYTNGSVAQSVIPTSVIPSGYALDGNYSHPARFQISNRVIQIGSNTSTILTTLLTMTITSNGILSLGLVKNSEESLINGNNAAFDTSHLNYVISHVVSGENVPQFKTSTNIVHSLAGGGTSDLNLDFPSAYTYPFSCNANDENDLGGFTLSLNGLTAFISPCGTLIPTPKPCP
jgi:hypothetical protein